MALIAGLGAALDYIAGQAGGDLEKGRIALVDNAQVNAAATRAGLVALGFTLFAPHCAGGGSYRRRSSGGHEFGRRGQGAEDALQRW